MRQESICARSSPAQPSDSSNVPIRIVEGTLMADVAYAVLWLAVFAVLVLAVKGLEKL